MSKRKSKFVCQQCGFETLRWLGRCPECSEWNTFVEEMEKLLRKREKQGRNTATSTDGNREFGCRTG